MGFIRLGIGGSGAAKLDEELEDSGTPLGSRSAGGGKLPLRGSLVRPFLQVDSRMGVALQESSRSLGSAEGVVLQGLQGYPLDPCVDGSRDFGHLRRDLFLRQGLAGL